MFDINDFDETAQGPFEWDVKRLAASVAVAGRELGLERPARREAVEAAVRSYREAMREFAALRNLGALVRPARRRAHPQPRRRPRDRGGAQPVQAAGRGRADQGPPARAVEADRARRRRGRDFVSRPPRIVPIEDLFPGVDVEEQILPLLRAYRRSLPVDRKHLLEGYRYAHMARRVGGVGSVGTRAWVVLLIGRDGDDPLFLQVKQAGPSVLERYAGRRTARNHGQRVVHGQRLMQVDGDIFLGWLRAGWVDDTPRDYYLRQLWDWKLGADVEEMSAARLTVYVTLCGWTLARAHARSGDRIAIAAYLGSGNAFDRALATFAEAYADQTQRDHAALERAVREGRVAAERGV